MRIVYVGSYGRSGSTLLGRALAEAPSAICIGETRYLWSRGLLDNVECGCGVRFRSCPFWSSVGAQAFGGWSEVDARRLAEIDRLTNLLRTLPFYWTPGLRKRRQRTIEEYATYLSSLYAAIAEVSGAQTVVEISKDPTFACLLAMMPGHDVRVIHLVRDPRAVAHSWMRRRREPSPIAGRDFMPQFHPAETATKWLAWNAGLRLLSSAGLPYVKVLYEDFLAEPEAILAALADFAGELPQPRAWLRGDQVRLGDHHMFSGNPMRTSSGWITLRVDDQWRGEMARSDYAAVSAITWPMLRAYGYRTSRTVAARHSVPRPDGPDPTKPEAAEAATRNHALPSGEHRG